LYQIHQAKLLFFDPQYVTQPEQEPHQGGLPEDNTVSHRILHSADPGMKKVVGLIPETNKFDMIGNYLRLVKFSHTLFAMPFALASFFLAVGTGEGALSWRLLVLVVAAMVLARNAAMAFNRYIDREIDKANPRTSMREIPAGVIPAQWALLFIIINSVLFMFVAWLINQLCFALSPLALLVILGYSLTKRFTALCHLILGLGLALAPVGAWLAVTGSFALTPVLIGIAVLLWVAGFDIIYALQDEHFDLENRLRSIPATIGRKRAMNLSSALHLLSFATLTTVAWLTDFTITGWSATLIFGAMLLYQHLIINPKDISRVNLAFFTTNGIASIIWGAGVILDQYLA
jgi:4-hydroxybenzoate polyprenyltransferase